MKLKDEMRLALSFFSIIILLGMMFFGHMMKSTFSILLINDDDLMEVNGVIEELYIYDETMFELKLKDYNCLFEISNDFLDSDYQYEGKECQLSILKDNREMMMTSNTLKVFAFEVENDVMISFKRTRNVALFFLICGCIIFILCLYVLQYFVRWIIHPEKIKIDI